MATSVPSAGGRVGPRAAERDAAIDIIRGFCLVSMFIGHLAHGTVAERIVHLPPWIDGASGFVLMSGLVLGMVQPGRIARAGLRSATVSLLRRARLLYLAHVSTVILAFVAAPVMPWDGWLPRTSEHGGVFGSAVQTLLLRVNPHDIDILSMYVLLLLLAAAAVPLLVAGRTWVVAGASAVLWLIALALPAATTLPTGSGEPSNFNWGAWQALFISAFIIGWHWKRGGVAALINSRRGFTIASASGAGAVAFGVVFARIGLVPTLQPAAEAAYDKADLGPGRLVLAWCAFAFLYAVLTHAPHRYRTTWLGPVKAIGQRSLDAFMILTVATILLPVLAGHKLTGGAAMASAGAALALSYAWVVLRDGRTPHSAVMRTRMERDTVQTVGDET